MTAAEIIFWLSLAILFYCYAGYGIFLYIWNRVKNIFARQAEQPFELLPVTLIVPSYNEEQVIAQKITNTLAIDYPRELLTVIFITDGSTDGSIELIGQHDNIIHLHQSERKGKSAAIRRAMRFVESPIVVFTDANSMLNPACLRSIMKHYTGRKVGGVAGEKKIQKDQRSVVGQAEGMYWRYESFMKKQDAEFNTVVGAAGELFSIRTELFEHLDEEVILDDFIISMQVCLKGYKIKYEPAAYAIESPSSSLEDEEKRKTRIGAGAYQSISYLKACFNILKFPLLCFQFFSRRLLRWFVSPLLIFLLLLTNIWLVVYQQGILFDYLLLAQGIFYSIAFIGRLAVIYRWELGIFNIPFYFLFMNYCLVKGFFDYIQGHQSVLWEKSLREAIE